MPPQLALLICICFIAWLFQMDKRRRKAASPALWIPGIWIVILGSRPVAYWLGGSGDPNAGDLEGSPHNLLVLGALIISAVVVLQRRGLDWTGLIGRNKALFLIYLYFAMSAWWSDYTFVSLKRLVKDFGCVPVALVILTEVDPVGAVRTVFVRASYLLFPLSVVFIKYFPAVGRNFSISGEPMYTGVTTQKNSLGEVLLVFGLMILWDFVEMRKIGKARGERAELLTWYAMFLMGLWLMLMCNSRTALVCVIVGMLILAGGGLLVRMNHPRRIIWSLFVGVVVLSLIDSAFGISQSIVKSLGRNTTYTGRTEIWREVKEQPINPLIGCGFLTFWDTKMGSDAIDGIGARINTAHNGYLEIYLDGGILGLTLLGIMVLAGGMKVTERLLGGTLWGRMSFAIWICALVYNNSESDFFRFSPLWFTLLLVIIERPQPPPCAEHQVNSPDEYIMCSSQDTKPVPA